VKSAVQRRLLALAVLVAVGAVASLILHLTGDPGWPAWAWIGVGIVGGLTASTITSGLTGGGWRP
jgi:hypothetical protein